MKLKEKKLGKIKETIIFGRALKGSFAALAIFVLAFVFMPYIIAKANASNTVDLDINWGAVSLTLDPDYEATQGGGSIDDVGHGDVEFGEITPTESNTSTGNYGTMKVEKKTLAVTTTGKYYTIYLSTSGSEQDLVRVGDSGASISKTDGTWASPVAFNESGWGFAVPGTNIPASSSSSTLPAFTTDCDSSAYLDTDLTVATGGDCYTDATWAQVPASGSPQQIVKKQTNNTSGFANDTTDVFYGTMIDTGVMAGTYQQEIVYTALASSQSLDKVSTNLARTVRYGAAGDTQTISFDLAESAQSSSISADDVEVYVVPHSVISASPVYDSTTGEYDVSSLDPDDYQQCDVQTFSIDNQRSTLTCNMPVGQIVDDQTAGSIATDSIRAGKYDYWVHIKGYNYNYISKVDNGNREAFAYVGLQSTYYGADGEAHYVTTMQEMETKYCNNTYKWGKNDDYTSVLSGNVGVNGLRTNGILYAPSVDVSTGTVSWSALSGNASDSGTLSKGSFNLLDTRDGKRYVVRRYNTGDCWMAQNLNLDLYAGVTLTPDDTNLHGRNWSLESKPVSSAAEPNPGWTADGGSTREAWQIAHGLETVTLKQYNYTNGAWDDGTVLGACTGGTYTSPCFAVTTGSKYYKIADQADVAAGRASNVGDRFEVTDAIAADLYSSEGYTTAVRAFSGGMPIFGEVTYQVKKIDAVTSSTTGWTSQNVAADGSLIGNNSSSCTFSFYNDRLASTTACVLTTTGDPIITQKGSAAGSASNASAGMSGYGMSVTAISMDMNGDPISFMNNTGTATTLEFDSDTSSTVTWPFATNAGDFRWERRGGDGAHVYDYGPVEYGAITFNESTGAMVGTHGAGTACSNVGLVSGTLKDSDDNTVEYLSCLDSNGQAKAETTVDGNWYSWYAAVAGSSLSSFSGVNATDSICPKGWQLPTYSGDKSFNNLFVNGDLSYGMSNSGSTRDYGLLSAPLSYVRSGNYAWNSTGLNYRGSYGYYWSLRSHNTTCSNLLSFYSSRLSPQSYSYRGYGYAVRCVSQ